MTSVYVTKVDASDLLYRTGNLPNCDNINKNWDGNVFQSKDIVPSLFLNSNKARFLEGLTSPDSDPNGSARAVEPLSQAIILASQADKSAPGSELLRPARAMPQVV